MISRSGLQREVLSLYRRLVPVPPQLESKVSGPPGHFVWSMQNPKMSNQKFRLFVRYTFHMNAANISPRNISFIEHLLRKGRRQIESYEDPAVRDCWVSEEMVAWNATWKRSAIPESSA
jgi:succinate dehydrogenase assembly factor 1